MPKTIEKMWEIGRDAAYNPSRWTRVKHSAFGHRNKKPGAVAKNLASGLVELIEPPFVGTLITEAIDAVLSRERERRLKNKLQGYKLDGNLEKEVKHGIKTLDMEELDRARAKVRDAIKDLNKQLKSLKYWDEPCKSIVDITQSYHYLDKRVDLLIARARVAEEISKKTAEWGEKIKDDMASKKLKTDIKLKEMMDTAKKSYMDEDHKHCDRSICIKI